jgi:S-formylglutathione hydrolase FrmB
LLVLIAAAFACADAHDDVMDVVSSMAGALTEVDGIGPSLVRGNVSRFMSAFSKDMPDYGTLESNVTALVRQAEVSSSIQTVSEDGDDQARTIDLDWVMQVRSLEQDGPVVQRREVIHCELRKEKKHWKIVSLKPIDFFAPPQLAQ